MQRFDVHAHPAVKQGDNGRNWAEFVDERAGILR